MRPIAFTNFLKKILPILLALITVFIFIGFASAHSSREFNPEIPKGLIFQLEVGPLAEPLSASITEAFNLHQEVGQPAGTHLYRLGAFDSYYDAVQQEKLLHANGLQAVAVIAYFNQKSISLDNAMVLLDNHNELDQQAMEGAPEKEVEPKVDLYYKVQVGSFRQQVPMDHFKAIDDLSMEVTADGIFKYTAGRYATFAEASQAQAALVESGMEGAFVVPYFNGARISAVAARKMEVAPAVAQEDAP
ncbi:MAG: SPOR domain-containing protein [Bacteroidota bacterium]